MERQAGADGPGLAYGSLKAADSSLPESGSHSLKAARGDDPRVTEAIALAFVAVVLCIGTGFLLAWMLYA